MDEFPVITEPDMQTGIRNCAGCGKEGYPGYQLQQFGIKTSSSSRQLVTYCRECCIKAATGLLQPWVRKEENNG